MLTGEGLIRGLAGWLPRGRGLADADWLARHRIVCWVLAAHLPAIFVYGVLARTDLAHLVLELAPVAALLAVAALARRRLVRALGASVGLLVCSAVIVHISEGLVEAHFHYFVAVALVGLYQEWAVYAAAILFVLVQHGVFGAMGSHVFGHTRASAWAWAAVHAGFILALSAAQLVFWRHNEQSLRRALHAEAANAALAERAAVSDEQRELASLLQRSLLPQELPTLHGLSTEARYLAASSGTEVGGDFYDVVALRDGCVGIAIGDVSGHGIRAAALMGQLRTALHAYAIAEERPSMVLARLNQMLVALDVEQIATAAYAVIDPATGTVTYASAGHLPLLIVPASTEEPVRLLDDVSGMPLGVDASATFDEGRTSLPAGATVVGYTDGLVERRHESIDVGLDRLMRRASGRRAADIGPLVDDLLGLRWEGTRDDTAIIATRLAAETAQPLDLSIPAATEELPGLREQLADWLRSADADEEMLQGLTLAASEAVTAAIRYADPAAHDMIEVHGDAIHGHACITVRDYGGRRRHAPDGTDPGRALTIIEALVERFEVEQRPDGTTVLLCCRLQPAASPTRTPRAEVIGRHPTNGVTSQ
jgi:anti-sigma regulatory factor (Ser/Thr protein kinase)